MKELLMALLIVVMIAAVGTFVFAHHVEESYGSDLGGQIFYDSQLNDYYDSNGIVIDGQNVGSDIQYLRDHPRVITEDGSLE